MRNAFVLLFIALSLVNCRKNNGLQPSGSDTSMYFPSNSGAEWETTSADDLGWHSDAIADLKSYLAAKHTKSFMILVNGRIVVEAYFDGHNATTNWAWNSAGKTLVSATTGIAQQEGLLTINERASDYLGAEWTNMTLEKENLIKIKHLLTMTSGIDDSNQLVVKSNLNYVADAGTRWAYGNVFQKLTAIVANASQTDFESYFNEKLKNRIGMKGYWNFGVIYTIFHSDTRSMARFGLLALNNGRWQGEQIIDADFFTECSTTSQSLNLSYGYFWWLNGKTAFMLPSSQTVFPGKLVPNAPDDMFAAMGANDQRLYVVPSRKMVIVRMGDASDSDNSNFAVSGFDNELWAKINAVIN